MTITHNRRASRARLTNEASRQLVRLGWLRWDALALIALAAVLSASLAQAVTLPPTHLDFSVDQPPAGVELLYFYPVERNDQGTFRWSSPESVVVIPLTAPANYRIRITMQDNPAVRPPRTVTVRIGRRTVGAFQLTSAPHEYIVEPTPTAWGSVVNQAMVEQQQLTITMATTAYTAPGDSRELGVIVSHIAIEPAQSVLGRWRVLLVPNLLLILALYLIVRVAGVRTSLAAALVGGLVTTFAFITLGGRSGALLLAYQPVVHWRQCCGAALALLLTALLWRALWPRRRRSAREPVTPVATPAPRWRLAPAVWREVILMLLLLFAYGFTYHPFGWNENSRYDLVQALVDDGTTRIDRTQDNTGDKSFHDGHWYSDKAPGGALLGVPAYAALRGVAALTGIQPTVWQYWRACAFLGAVVPSMLLVLLLLRFLRAYVEEWWALAIALGYGLGTIAFPFASLFFSHAAAAAFLFATFFVLWRTPPGSRAWPLLLAGFLAGWAVLLEYPAALGVVALLFYATCRERRALPLMVLGALPPAFVLLGYNWVSFGGPFAIGYANLTDPQFVAGMSQGIMGVSWPKPDALGKILIGPRGLLRLAPWLAAAPLGLWSLWRGSWARREIALCAAIVVLFLLYNAGYYQPIGGTTPGPRFLLAALPSFAVLVAFAPRCLWPFIATLIACAIVLFSIVTLTMPLAFQYTHDPLADIWLPKALAHTLTDTTASLAWQLTGGLPLLILFLMLGCALLALFATTRPQAAARRLALGLTVLLAVGVLLFGYPLDLTGKADARKLNTVHEVAASSSHAWSAMMLQQARPDIVVAAGEEMERT